MSPEHKFSIKIGDIFELQSVIATNIGPAEDAQNNQLYPLVESSS